MRKEADAVPQAGNKNSKERWWQCRWETPAVWGFILVAGLTWLEGQPHRSFSLVPSLPGLTRTCLPQVTESLYDRSRPRIQGFWLPGQCSSSPRNLELENRNYILKILLTSNWCSIILNCVSFLLAFLTLHLRVERQTCGEWNLRFTAAYYKPRAREASGMGDGRANVNRIVWRDLAGEGIPAEKGVSGTCR